MIDKGIIIFEFLKSFFYFFVGKNDKYKFVFQIFFFIIISFDFNLKLVIKKKKNNNLINNLFNQIRY